MLTRIEDVSQDADDDKLIPFGRTWLEVAKRKAVWSFLLFFIALQKRSHDLFVYKDHEGFGQHIRSFQPRKVYGVLL